MEAGVAGGEDAAALARVAALPGRDDAAGAFYDRDQRQNVEILEPGLDDEIDLAKGEQARIVAIAAKAPETDGGCEGGEAGLLLLCLKQVGARGCEQCL